MEIFWAWEYGSIVIKPLPTLTLVLALSSTMASAIRVTFAPAELVSMVPTVVPGVPEVEPKVIVLPAAAVSATRLIGDDSVADALTPRLILPAVISVSVPPVRLVVVTRSTLPTRLMPPVLEVEPIVRPPLVVMDWSKAAVRTKGGPVAPVPPRSIAALLVLDVRLTDPVPALSDVKLMVSAVKLAAPLSLIVPADI